MRGFIYILLVLISGSLPGQKLSEDLAKMYKTYANLPVLFTEIQIEYFNVASSSKADKVQTGILKKKGSEYYYKMDQTEMLVNNKEVILIDHGQKNIVYNEINGSSISEYEPQMFDENLDSVIKNYELVEYLGLNGNNKKYIIKTPEKAIVSTELYLDKSDFHIARIVYEYNQDQSFDVAKVDITYKTFNRNYSFPPDAFSSAKYMKKENGKMDLSDNYRGYYLVTVNNQ